MDKYKKCPKCGVNKTLNEFTKSKSRKDGFGPMCLDCRKQYSKWHYKTNKKSYLARITLNKKRVKEFFIRFKKTQNCSKCGDTRWYVLDFHHTEDKETNIATMAGEGYSIESLKIEIRKCIVLCANCHRELHYLEKNSPLV